MSPLGPDLSPLRPDLSRSVPFGSALTGAWLETPFWDLVGWESVVDYVLKFGDTPYAPLFG